MILDLKVISSDELGGGRFRAIECTNSLAGFWDFDADVRIDGGNPKVSAAGVKLDAERLGRSADGDVDDISDGYESAMSNERELYLVMSKGSKKEERFVSRLNSRNLKIRNVRRDGVLPPP